LKRVLLSTLFFDVELRGFRTRIIVAGVAGVFGLAWLYGHIPNYREPEESDAEKK
jgi:hypothetical protein